MDGLRVKLEVLDKGNGALSLPDGTSSFLLAVEETHIDLNRQPVVFSLPMINAGSKGGAPVAYALDFGMLSEMITLKGVSADAPQDFYHSFTDLQTISRTSWRYVTISTSGGQVVVKGGVRLTMDMGTGQGVKEYHCVVLGLTGDRLGGQLRWEWTWKFQVVEWPNQGAMADGSI